MKPRVSIIVPMLNASRYVTETLESVRSQTCSDWELVVVDDGSTDPSADSVAAWLAQHGKGVMLRHPGGENRGTSASRNLGAAQASGEFLCFLDADDVWEPDFLEWFLAVFDRHPDVAMAYCPALLWHGDGGVSRDQVQKPGIASGRVCDPVLLFELFLDGRADTPSPSGVMIRRHAFIEAGGWEGAFRGMYDDQVLYSKLLLAGTQVYLIERCLYRYRQHEESLCRRADRERKEPQSRKVYLEWLRQHLAGKGELTQRMSLLLAEQLWYSQRRARREAPAGNGYIASLVEVFREQSDPAAGIKLICRILSGQVRHTIRKAAAVTG